MRLPPSASAVARAPGTENASNRLLIDCDGDNGDNRPPVTTTCRETELATSKLRWTPRTTASTGSMRIAADTPLATPLAIGCTAPATSIVTLTVPGLRRDARLADDESTSSVATAASVASAGGVGSMVVSGAGDGLHRASNGRATRRAIRPSGNGGLADTAPPDRLPNPR